MADHETLVVPRDGPERTRPLPWCLHPFEAVTIFRPESVGVGPGCGRRAKTRHMEILANYAAARRLGA